MRLLLYVTRAANEHTEFANSKLGKVGTHDVSIGCQCQREVIHFGEQVDAR